MTGKNSWRIRAGRPDDLTTLAQIEASAHLYPWPDSTLLWCLTANTCRSFILESDSQILGYALFEQVLDEATLLNITIAPDVQLQGLGRELLRHGLTTLSAEVCRVLLEVRMSNQAALALYQKNGFIHIGVRKNYYPNGDTREDAIVMECSLNQTLQPSA